MDNKEMLKAISEMMDSKLGGLNETVNALTETVSEIQINQNNMHSDLNKNTMLVETLSDKITTLAEIHETHVGQNKKQIEELNTNVSAQTSLLDLAVRSLTKDISTIRTDMKAYNQVIGEHQIEIVKIKNKFDELDVE